MLPDLARLLDVTALVRDHHEDEGAEAPRTARTGKIPSRGASSPSAPRREASSSCHFELRAHLIEIEVRRRLHHLRRL
jgi:hypothetical protein